MRALVLGIVGVTICAATGWAAMHPAAVAPGAEPKKPKQVVAIPRLQPQSPLIISVPGPAPWQDFRTSNFGYGPVGGRYIGVCPGGVVLENWKTANCPPATRDLAGVAQ